MLIAARNGHVNGGGSGALSDCRAEAIMGLLEENYSALQALVEQAKSTPELLQQFKSVSHVDEVVAIVASHGVVVSAEQLLEFARGEGMLVSDEALSEQDMAAISAGASDLQRAQVVYDRLNREYVEHGLSGW